ncbi:MAG: ribonuclease P protein component [Flavobacteriaceae bacterium]|nr:MAG: ribonuclease P protein component [Flavobacteriaceae bacterium]
MDYSLGKEKKLKKRKDIELLFQKGIGKNFFPLRAIYLPQQEPKNGVKVLFSVPKKRFKKAVDRNKIKRLLREAYRLNQPKDGPGLHLAFIYVSSELPAKNSLQIPVMDSLVWIKESFCQDKNA